MISQARHRVQPLFVIASTRISASRCPSTGFAKQSRRPRSKNWFASSLRSSQRRLYKRINLSSVMVGHSRSKNGVASLAYAIHIMERPRRGWPE